jgi:DNA modification methylase
MNQLILGDCLEVLKKMESESVDLIYLDPPFFSNRNYELIWGDAGEIRSFQDRWSGGIDHYIAWLKERVQEMHRVLKATGSIFLHCDWHANAYIRVYILDKIFGERNFRNDIIWYYGAKATQNESVFQRKHDIIFFYSKHENYKFKVQVQEYSETSLAERDTRYKFKDKEGYYRLTTRRDKNGEKYRAKVYLREGVAMTDVWEIGIINATSKERIGYPTQKPEALLERIIRCASNEGDLVLDPFVGGGTTVVVAEKLNRQWIGIDQSVSAIKVSESRIQVLRTKQPDRS